MKKEIGFIGLGKMGSNMVLNLLEKKYRVVVYDISSESVKKISAKGAVASYSIKNLVDKLSKPRAILMMIPAGKPVDNVLNDLLPILSKGDIVIDGGNSYYKDSIKRYNQLRRKGISFIDMGTSGGVVAARKGASLTIGGDKKSFEKLRNLFKDLSFKNSYGYFGESGAGHFIKTVHNGIEYALLESYAEGYEVLKKSKYKFNLEKVSDVWHNGSVISSKITDFAGNAFKKHGNDLKDFSGKIGGGETGNWSLDVANKEKVEVNNLKHAIEKRKQSLRKQSFSTKFISALRNEFGGHKEPK